ncbi:MAG: kinase/pyrophosphorylase, partial [Planctomycetota bacterium]|nr:kinase/pyrophosphorylase [Planctomycetota bacterium]
MVKSSPKSHPLNIVVVSGGTGRTGALVVNSALAQFRKPSVCVTNEPQIRKAAELRRVIRDAKRNNAVVCHTLVEPKLRSIAAQEAKASLVALVDILGPVVKLMADHLKVDPLSQPGLSYEVNKEQFDRMDAVDFTLAHDDGQRVGSLHKADVVLVGVSRVSKSVTCFFLAYRGIRAANVALTCATEPPPQLLKLDPARVVALT